MDRAPTEHGSIGLRQTHLPLMSAMQLKKEEGGKIEPIQNRLTNLCGDHRTSDS